MVRKFSLKSGIFLIALAIALTVVIGTIRAQSTPSLPPSGNLLQQYCSNQQNYPYVPPWYCTNVDPAAIQAWQGWMPIAYAVTVLSFMIGALLIMFGVAMRNDRMRIFGTGEMYEAMATAIIVILFSFVSAELFGILPGFFVGGYNPYSISLSYISQTINVTQNLLVNIYRIGTIDFLYATETIVVCQGEGPGFTCINKEEPISPILKFGVLQFFFWPAYSFADLSIPGFMALHLEFYFIIFLMYAAIPVFLIPGIIFRAFMPTRHLGGSMMALAIGVYFFMPILFSVAYYYTNTGVLQQLDSVTQALGAYGGCVAGGATCSNAVQNSVSPTSPLVEAIQNANNTLSAFWLSTLFYPALISAMTYAFIVQLGEIIGGMTKTSSRLRGL